jgi:ribosomal protein L1
MARGKTYRAIAERIDHERRYAYNEGMELLVASKRAKFDETAEVAFNLSVDPRHADQNVRGAVSLPHGTGKSSRIVVFAKGEKERRRARPARTRSALTSSRRRSPAAGSISTACSRPPT